MRMLSLVAAISTGVAVLGGGPAYAAPSRPATACSLQLR
jgi:hypothetical protein